MNGLAEIGNVQPYDQLVLETTIPDIISSLHAGKSIFPIKENYRILVSGQFAHSRYRDLRNHMVNSEYHTRPHTYT